MNFQPGGNTQTRIGFSHNFNWRAAQRLVVERHIQVDGFAARNVLQRGGIQHTGFDGAGSMLGVEFFTQGAEAVSGRIVVQRLSNRDPRAVYRLNMEYQAWNGGFQLDSVLFFCGHRLNRNSQGGNSEGGEDKFLQCRHVVYPYGLTY
ncbi:hypothetical protein D3C78_1367440 [compost metagenome]